MTTGFSGSNRTVLGALTAAASLGVLALSSPAMAQNLIKSPTAHSQYSVELEPHLAFDILGDDDFGLGARATFEIVDPGFVTSINNTVGIGVGLDWLDGDRCRAGVCRDRDVLFIPIVMQWNFWFTPHWSAFGEPGLTLEFRDDDFVDGDDTDIDVAFFVGGRYNFNDRIGLTLRLGRPMASFGVSFFL